MGKLLLVSVVFIAGVVTGAAVGIAGYRDSVPFSETVEGMAGPQLDTLSEKIHAPRIYRKISRWVTKTFDAIPWAGAAKN